MFRQRIRLQYTVTGDKRFLSHRDTMRLWHRALRRSGLPLRMSEGFNVRPRMSFALARGVGIASQSEWFEFELADWVNPDTARRTLAGELPEGIAIRSARAVPPGERAVVGKVTYRIDLAQTPDDLDARIDRLLACDELIVARGSERKPRRVDVRLLLLDLHRDDGHLVVAARCSEGGMLRPDELLAELGFDDEAIARSAITRTEAPLADQA